MEGYFSTGQSPLQAAVEEEEEEVEEKEEEEDSSEIFMGSSTKENLRFGLLIFNYHHYNDH